MDSLNQPVPKVSVNFALENGILLPDLHCLWNTIPEWKTVPGSSPFPNALALSGDPHPIDKSSDILNISVIYRVREGDKRLYRTYQFMVGLYEFELKDLDKEFAELFEQYLPWFGMSMIEKPGMDAPPPDFESTVNQIRTERGVA